MKAHALPTELAIPHRDGTLIARLPTLDDIPAVVRACQDPDISRWTTVPSAYDDAEGLGFVEFAAAGWGSRRRLEMVIIAPDTHPLGSVPLLGAVGGRIDWERAQGNVGYWVAADARNNGVASAALAAISRLLLDLGMQRLEADVLVGNPGSGPTLRKVGFQLEGVRRSVHANGCGLAERLDLELYSLLPGELMEP